MTKTLYTTEDQQIAKYRKSLHFVERNALHQKEKLDEALLAQKGIDTQESGIANFAQAIGDEISKNLTTSREVKPRDKMKEMVITEPSSDVFGTIVKPVEKKTKKERAQPTIPPPSKLIYSNPKYEQNLMNQEDQLSQMVEYKLKSLSIDKDRQVREMVMNYLDDAYDKAVKANEKKLITKLMDAIERQRMVDAFEEYSKDATKNAFADKLKRNISALIYNKHFMESVKARRLYEKSKSTQKKIAQNRQEMLIEDAESNKPRITAKIETTVKQTKRGAPSKVYVARDAKQRIDEINKQLSKKFPEGQRVGRSDNVVSGNNRRKLQKERGHLATKWGIQKYW